MFTLPTKEELSALAQEHNAQELKNIIIAAAQKGECVALYPEDKFKIIAEYVNWDGYAVNKFTHQFQPFMRITW